MLKQLIKDTNNVKFYKINNRNFTTVNDFCFYMNFIFDDIKSSYPKFDEWLATKVFPDLIFDNRIIVLAYQNNILAGGLILKVNENKISTLFVKKEFRLLGIGSDFVDISKSLLNIEKLNISLLNNNFNLYFPFFEKQGFVVDYEDQIEKFLIYNTL